jgi:hypothetical protein
LRSITKESSCLEDRSSLPNRANLRMHEVSSTQER